MRCTVLIVLIFVIGGVTVAQTRKQPSEKDIAEQVEAIRAECESDVEAGSLFHTEIVINKTELPYPAVGTFKSTVKFYYTYGDRERNPYPDRLTQVFVDTQRSAVSESSSYCFAKNGKLIFHFLNDADGELRIYLSNGSVLRALRGAKPVSPATIVRVRDSAIAEGARLNRLFAETLKF